MDADTRPNTQLLAHVGVRGATAADLYKALGWPRERLDAALKGLRASRLLVLRPDGRFYQPHLLPVPQDPPPAPKPKRKRNQANERPASEYNAERRSMAARRYENLLKLRAEGLSNADIARLYRRNPRTVARQMLRALRWDTKGRP